MQLSGFDDFLRKRSNSDKYLYGGYSAGICVLSKTIEGLQLADAPINPYNSDEVLYDGIGILDYTPIPHYKSNNPEFSEKIQKIINYYQEHNIKYKTLKDGEILIEDIGAIER